MKIRSLLLSILLFGTGAAHADHVLLQSGKGLFNVVLDDIHDTASRPLRVRYRYNSFEYDFDSHAVAPLLGHAGRYDVADFATTSTAIGGKTAAHRFMLERGWQRYVAPPPVIIRPPTPTPTLTPTPPPKIILKEGELAEETLPMSERIAKQLEIFIREQTGLGERIQFEQKVGGFDAAAGKELRLRLLDRQITILRDYYPTDEDRVKKAIEALEDQKRTVEKTGKFSHEY